MRTLFIIPLVLMSLVSFPSWGETLTMDDLVKRNDLYYKKFTNVPFIGEIFGLQNGGFKKGKRTGERLYYDKNGQLWSEKNYKDGILDGLSELYHENGQLMIIGNYEDGKADGLWELFNEDGSLNKSETFKDGV